MAIRKTKPTSPGRRFATYQLREQLTASEPEKSLTEGISKTGGRNVNGRVTSRHRGGGAKRRYRKIDFKRLKDGVPAKVATIEYDPNRSAYIALLNYADGEKAYILAPSEIAVGDAISSGPGSDIRPGNCLALGRLTRERAIAGSGHGITHASSSPGRRTAVVFWASSIASVGTGGPVS